MMQPTNTDSTNPWVQDWFLRKIQAPADMAGADNVQQALALLADQLGGGARPRITGPGGPGDNEGPGTGEAGGAPGSSGSVFNTVGQGAISRAANGAATNVNQELLPPELSDLMNLLMGRMRYQEPLFQAITQQAMGGLPRPYNGRPALGPATPGRRYVGNNTFTYTPPTY